MLVSVAFVGVLIHDGALRVAGDKGGLDEAILVLLLIIFLPPVAILTLTKIIMALNRYFKP
ncbi:hypothetical protein ACI0FM_03125 [Paenochrobactrum sp. BZR 588]|uniref:hypothetical protein n=1 Tax=Paenochrobactrum sp. BZR 588 TaxID=3378076 RepID=UPI003853174E